MDAVCSGADIRVGPDSEAHRGPDGASARLDAVLLTGEDEIYKRLHHSAHLDLDDLAHLSFRRPSLLHGGSVDRR